MNLGKRATKKSKKPMPTSTELKKNIEISEEIINPSKAKMAIINEEENTSKREKTDKTKGKARAKRKTYKPKGTQRSVRSRLGTLNDIPKKMFKTTATKKEKRRSRSAKRIMSKSSSRVRLKSKRLKIKKDTNPNNNANKILALKKKYREKEKKKI